MSRWLLISGGILFAFAIAYVVFRSFKKREVPAIRFLIGTLTIGYGAYLATLTGSTTSLVIPGVQSIALGAATGGAIGFGTWVVVGTIGVVTGGVGVAVGAASMMIVGAVFGGAGGAAGGFGHKIVTYPLVAWYFWVPIIMIGILFLVGWRKKKFLLKELPQRRKHKDVS